MRKNSSNEILPCGTSSTRIAVKILTNRANSSQQWPSCQLKQNLNGRRNTEPTLNSLQGLQRASRSSSGARGSLYAPEVLVVGHQTDGKSALVEALMGFQFNQVGGGTKSQARAVESLVRTKMQHKEFIILCLEDCSDWSNAMTRRVVMQVDPELSRTVIVSTKLDTKIPQFARSSDVEVFLSPPACTLEGFILGDSPFYTSVPSGRVGSAIISREVQDIASLEEKLGRQLSKQERSRIGVSKLRLFLEELLQKRYMDSVPLIIHLLEKEYHSTTRKLTEINKELSTLDEVKLRERGRAFRDLFLTKLSLLLKGTVVAPPDKFGETLVDERGNGEAFVGADGLQLPHKIIPNRAGLSHFLDSFGGTEPSSVAANSIPPGNSQQSLPGSVAAEKHETKARADAKLSHISSGIDSCSSAQTAETKLADLLDSTLWNRRLGPSSERIVYALFNCFLLMPVVDKLPAHLRKDLESAFSDDMDVCLTSAICGTLWANEREIQRLNSKGLKDKFKVIHQQLSSCEKIPSLSPACTD
ncbi:Dynamin-like protein ARC5 [Hibiscus syriacus]|uniref:Dynamin-like protein ARC5 n=1 Tax=Hibiscus syriacus TaxID=106335 RepID=A0A6A2YC96_HIBSY|nr:Dynamin-like protein ARC5 [Hibiscus syriacus]